MNIEKQFDEEFQHFFNKIDEILSLLKLHDKSVPLSQGKEIEMLIKSFISKALKQKEEELNKSYENNTIAREESVLNAERNWVKKLKEKEEEVKKDIREKIKGMEKKVSDDVNTKGYRLTRDKIALGYNKALEDLKEIIK